MAVAFVALPWLSVQVAVTDLEVGEPASRLRDRDDEAVGRAVGAGTVAAVLTVGDDDETVVERQSWPL